MESVNNIEKTIMEKDKYESRLTEYVDTLRMRSNKEKLKEFAEFRNFPLSAVEKAGIFYIGEMAEMLVPTFLSEVKDFGVISSTNKKPIFSNRYIIPIYNEFGRVQNLVGYSSEANERYIYGTAKYYRRKDTMYGLENLDIAYEMGYAVYLEGITDAIRLRSLGIPNAFANCGTHRSDYILSQLNRCRHGIIKIPDRDAAGNEAKKGWVTNRNITLYPPLKYKDIDEMLRVDENVEWFMDYFKECVKLIQNSEHKGATCLNIEVTIL